jgi:hypothetical protein
MNFKPFYRPRNILIASILISIPAIIFNPNFGEVVGWMLGIALILWVYNKIMKIDYDSEEEYEND